MSDAECNRRHVDPHALRYAGQVYDRIQSLLTDNQLEFNELSMLRICGDMAMSSLESSCSRQIVRDHRLSRRMWCQFLAFFIIDNLYHPDNMDAEGFYTIVTRDHFKLEEYRAILKSLRTSPDVPPRDVELRRHAGCFEVEHLETVLSHSLQKIGLFEDTIAAVDDCKIKTKCKDLPTRRLGNDKTGIVLDKVVDSIFGLTPGIVVSFPRARHAWQRQASIRTVAKRKRWDHV